MGQITVQKNLDGIEGLCLITPAVHDDSRGYFMETYSEIWRRPDSTSPSYRTTRA